MSDAPQLPPLQVTTRNLMAKRLRVLQNYFMKSNNTVLDMNDLADVCGNSILGSILLFDSVGNIFKTWYDTTASKIIPLFTNNETNIERGFSKKYASFSWEDVLYRSSCGVHNDLATGGKKLKIKLPVPPCRVPLPLLAITSDRTYNFESGGNYVSLDRDAYFESFEPLTAFCMAWLQVSYEEMAVSLNYNVERNVLHLCASRNDTTLESVQISFERGYVMSLPSTVWQSGPRRKLK